MELAFEIWSYPLLRLPEWLVLSAFFYLGSGLPQRLQNAREGMAWNVAFSSFEGIVCETAVLGIGIEEIRSHFAGISAHPGLVPFSVL
jgi:hypothetical protein